MHKIILVSIGFFMFNSCIEAQTGQEEAVEAEVHTNDKIQGPINQVVAAEEFQQLLTVENIQLIDVRTPGEYAAGYIDDAVNIDFFGANFKTEIDKLDKSKPTLIYCKSGGRSGKAAKMMKDLGFQIVYDLKGGYMNWPYK